MKLFKRISDYLNFTFAVVFLAGMVFTIGFGACLYMMRQEATKSVDEKVTSDINFVQNSIDSKLQRVEDVAFTALCNHFQSITSRKTDGSRQVEFDTRVALPSEESFFLFLEQLLATNPLVCGVAIGFEPGLHAPQGDYGFATYVTNVSGKNERLRLGAIHDYKQKPWYKGPHDKGTPVWSEPFRETSRGKVVCCYSYPIFDLGGKIIGAIALDIDTAPIQNDCKKVTPYPHAIVTVVDRNFKFVSHPDTTRLLSDVKMGEDFTESEFTDSIRDKMLRQERGHYTIGIGTDDEAVFYFCPVKRADWTITITCPTDDVYGQVSRMKHITTLIAIISILFMAMCLLFLMRRIKHASMARAGIEHELGLASNIQMGMIPKIYPAFPTRPELDICGFVKPAKTVGGDLYDYFVHEEKLYFCIGDVSGKGVPASLLMMVVISLFRNLARNFSDPAVIAQSLNQSIARNNPQQMFCTLFIGILNLADGQVQYCNAGHNYPILCRKEGDSYNAEYMHPEHNLPIGIFEDTTYIPGNLQILPGDAIFLYTDGVNEAEDSQHVQFGNDAVPVIIREEMNAHHSCDTLLSAVLSKIMAHTKGAEQNDDITMLHIIYKGTE